MSFRYYLTTVSALLLASLCGAATPANAADTQPLESCESGTRANNRSVGHPGKSALFPQRKPVQCSRPVRKSLTLAAYEDVPGGRALVAGKTERAIELIYAKQAKAVSAQTLINLCVAHTVLRQFEEASETCDTAVASANAMRADTRYRAGTSRKSLDEGAAVAYSNRAVLHLLSRNTVAAQNDLAHARTIAPKAFFVMRNSAVASQAPSLAQAAQVSVSIE